MKYPKTAARIKTAMGSVDIKAKDLALKTGIHKSSISQYVNGSHKPSDDAARKLSKALNVDAAWLKGFDVPMRNDYPEEMTPEQIATVSNFNQMAMLYHRMSEDGKKRLLSYAENLYALEQAEDELK